MRGPCADYSHQDAPEPAELSKQIRTRRRPRELTIHVASFILHGMTVLEFIASLVASLAWPVAIVVAVLVLRRQIPDVLRALRKVKISGFELELERTRVDVQEALSTRPGSEDAASDGEADDLTLRASQRDPIASILGSYSALEDELRKRLALAGIGDTDKKSGVQLVALGVSQGIFTEASAEAVRRVSVMRNLAAHGRGERVTVREAVEYAALVEATIYSLRASPSKD